jgi:type I restriction enzyme S subunit
MAEQHEKALVPQIRFTGFTDPWEQRKLGELFEEHSEKDRDDLPALTIIQGGGTVHRDESNRNLQFDRNSLSNYKVVDTGDFIVHLRSFEGGLEKATCCGLVSPAYHIFRGKNVDSDFYYLYFRSKRFIDADLKPHVYGIRDGRSIDIEGMKTIFIPWTNLAEQRRIGAFFDHLDSLITLHQRKYDKLCVLKKSMLDKMFPKGGSLYPEIRFAGFTDPWEQRKLGEVARRVTRKNENGDSDLPLTISAQYGLVDQRTFFNSQVASKDMSGYFLLHRGEFAYNKSTSTDSPWGAIKRLEKYDMGCVSTLYICFELLSGDSDFLVTYYETDRWYKSVQLIAAEGARNHGLLNIAPDDFFETQICIPKRIDEQRRIGAFFDRLDSLITLHQRKLELLRNIKKSMLDKMFV